MACMKLGTKPDTFHRQGQAWLCNTGLPTDVAIEVEDMIFHLHKFPLLSKSAVLETLITEKSVEGDKECVIQLPNIPGGVRSFELVAKFCYGVKLELTASNVVYLRCAAEHLEMTEELEEGNLIAQTEIFINQVILRNWRDSIRALQTCDFVLPYAENLQIVKRCVESVAVKACTDPNIYGWPILDQGPTQSPGGSLLWNGQGPTQSPGGSLLWNGISTGARPRNSSSDWWYEDVSSLSLYIFKRLISVMESRGMRPETIAGSLAYYAKRHLPGLNRRQSITETSTWVAPRNSGSAASEDDQRYLVEEIERLLPMHKGLVSTKFLFGLLRSAIILGAAPSCKSNLEGRIGMQLDQATLEDLLMPNVSDSMETLYDVDCVQRILKQFLAMDQAMGENSPGLVDDDQFMSSQSLQPLTTVAKLIDGYLAEIATDLNLKLPKFQSLAATVPEYARPLDDGLYRAIDIFLKKRPLLTESEREVLCRLIDCQKLSMEACTHATQNERLPLRVVIQVIFFEQLQLRSTIAGCYLMSDTLEGSRPLHSGPAALGVREDQALKVGMDSMRMRVSELEEEYSNMKLEIEKLGKGKTGGWSSLTKLLGFKTQMCSSQDGLPTGDQRNAGKAQKKIVKHKQ